MEQTLSAVMPAWGPACVVETKGKYLTFLTDGQLFGIPITYVVQIVGMQEIITIPDYPIYAKGVINLRGSIIPVIDVRIRLGKMEQEYTDRTCVIVSSVYGRNFGFVVDGVDEVIDIPDNLVSPPPQMGSDVGNHYLTGIAKLEDRDPERIALLIDTQKILGEAEYEALTQTAR